MTYVLLSAEIVDVIHSDVLNPGELQGMAGDKSLDRCLARVDNRLVFGMISDVFDLAAAYGVAAATGQVLDDAIKRTAYRSTLAVLDLNGVQIRHETVEAGDIIREVAQGRMDEEDLAAWLRRKAVSESG